MHGLGVGTIEGFYGRPWPDADRAQFFRFAAHAGSRFFIYAPKADRCLRGDWREPPPVRWGERIQQIGADCRSAGLIFGVGLTPLRLHEDFDSGRQALAARVRQLAALGVELLAVLFDDMPGALPELADTQARIIAQVRDIAPQLTIAMCPTYYTSHDILDRLYGPRPARYLETLGAALDSDVHVFWTGPRVCSADYPLDHLDEVSARLGRPPLLWDNYPVNDGQRMCQRLHLRAPTPRGPEVMRRVSGLAINPMNASWLSRLPILAMLREAAGATYTDREAATKAAFEASLSPALSACLLADVDLFQAPGALPSFDEAHLSSLRQKYAAHDHPAAREILAWLQGDYQVGPECITDAD